MMSLVRRKEEQKSTDVLEDKLCGLGGEEEMRM